LITGNYTDCTPILPDGRTLPSAGSQDVLLARYDPAGIFQWATAFGGSGAEKGRGLSTGPDGSILLADASPTAPGEIYLPLIAR
jgi:hypothetical protein